MLFVDIDLSLFRHCRDRFDPVQRIGCRCEMVRKGRKSSAMLDLPPAIG